MVGDHAADPGMFGTEPDVAQTADLSELRLTFLPVSITTGLFAFSIPRPGRRASLLRAPTSSSSWPTFRSQPSRGHQSARCQPFQPTSLHHRLTSHPPPPEKTRRHKMPCARSAPAHGVLSRLSFLVIPHSHSFARTRTARTTLLLDPRNRPECASILRKRHSPSALRPYRRSCVVRHMTWQARCRSSISLKSGASGTSSGSKLSSSTRCIWDVRREPKWKRWPANSRCMYRCATSQ